MNIRDGQASLGFKVCARTVARYMRRPYDGRPSPSWRQFLNQHANKIWACDLFTIHTVWLQTLYVFFVIGVLPELWTNAMLGFPQSEENRGEEESL